MVKRTTRYRLDISSFFQTETRFTDVIVGTDLTSNTALPHLGHNCGAARKSSGSVVVVVTGTVVTPGKMPFKDIRNNDLVKRKPGLKVSVGPKFKGTCQSIYGHKKLLFNRSCMVVPVS